MRWNQIIGRDVVDTSTAEPLGTVDGFVIDPEGSAVVAILVGDRAVSWSDADGIGDDALTLTGADLLHDVTSDLERRAVQGAGHPIGKRVITEDGVDIGTVADIEIDPSSGAVLQLVLVDDDVRGSRLIGIGSFAVVVSSPGRRAAEDDDDDLDGLSKAELYELAQDQDLEGRSSMTKQELIDALS